jgi:hypothetical protein
MKRLALAIPLILAACATHKVDPAVSAEAAQPLTCASKQQCDLYWQRAQAYVNQHSAFRVQSVTDTTLVTFGPSSDFGSSTSLAYRISRVPSSDGSAVIEITLACGDHIVGCSPDAVTETANLKRFIRRQ